MRNFRKQPRRDDLRAGAGLERKIMDKLKQYDEFISFAKTYSYDAYMQVVYFHFLLRSNESVDNGWFPFSIRELVRYTGIGSVNTVRQAIKNLKQAGLIQAKHKEKSVTFFRLMPLTSSVQGETPVQEKIADGIVLVTKTFIHFG